MQLKVNETRSHKVENETVNGLNISVLLESEAVNTDVPLTGYMTDGVGFDASQIDLEVVLKRDGKNIVLIAGNLANVAHYFTLERGGYLWRKGLNVQAKAAGATHIVNRMLFVDFCGHLNIKGSDELIVTATLNRAALGDGISSATSLIQIETNQSIGIEHGIYRFNSYAIQASQNSDVVNLGDNVTRMALISYETDYTKPIFRNVSLSSDRLDWTANEQELPLRHWKEFTDNVADHLLSATSTSAHPLFFPHSFLLHDVNELDRAKLSFTLNSPNVLASKNFVIWTSYETSHEILEKAMQLSAKHERKNIDKVPIAL